VFLVAHTALQELLVVAPASAREEMLRQVAARFPFYKMPHYRQLNLLEIPNRPSRTQVMPGADEAAHYTILTFTGGSTGCAEEGGATVCLASLVPLGRRHDTNSDRAGASTG